LDWDGSATTVERLRWFAQSVLVLIVVEVLGVVVLEFEVLELGLTPDVVFDVEVEGVELEAVVFVPDKLPLVLALPLCVEVPEVGLFRSQFVPRVLAEDPERRVVDDVSVAVVEDCVPVADGEL
jgi:hypothetical protein